MDMENINMFVDYAYCKTCKHRDLKDNLDPCCECLDNPVNSNSVKPYYYTEDEKKVKEEAKKKAKENKE